MNPDSEPLVNMRFRVEIEGMQGVGAVEVLFPEARLVSGSPQYGILTVRRGLTKSGEWYEWWERARTSGAGPKKTVTIVLLDRAGADVNRWTFRDVTPSAYFVSKLNALGSEPILETLELSVGGFTAVFGG